MALSVGDLVAHLNLDTRNFSAGVTKAQAGLKTVEASTIRADRAVAKASYSTSMMTSSLRMMAVQAAGVTPVVGTLVSGIGQFAIGSVMMTGVIAGLAAVAIGWRKLGEEARAAKAKLDDAVTSMLARQAKEAGPPESVRQQQEIQRAFDAALERRTAAAAELARIQRAGQAGQLAGHAGRGAEQRAQSAYNDALDETVRLRNALHIANFQVATDMADVASDTERATAEMKALAKAEADAAFRGGLLNQQIRLMQEHLDAIQMPAALSQLSDLSANMFMGQRLTARAAPTPNIGQVSRPRVDVSAATAAYGRMVTQVNKSTSALSNFGSGIKSAIGKMLKPDWAQVGSNLVGSAISWGVGKVVGWVGKLFGGEEKARRKEQRARMERAKQAKSAEARAAVSPGQRNMPSGFKLALETYYADTGRLAPKAPSQKFAGEPVAITPVHIGSITVITDDPDKMYQQIVEQGQRAARRGGVTGLQLAAAMPRQ